MQKGAKTKGWCFAKAKPPEYKVDKDELRKRLTPTQFRVTQDQATERYANGMLRCSALASLLIYLLSSATDFSLTFCQASLE